MKPKKQIPVYGIVIIDLVLTVVFFGAFISYEYLLPHEGDSNGTVVLSGSDIDSSFALPSDSQTEKENNSNAETSAAPKAETSASQSDSEAETETQISAKMPSSRKKGSGNAAGNSRSNQNTQDMTADKSQSDNISNTSSSDKVLNTYKSDNANITVYEKTFGEGSDKVTYYVADCYVTSAAEIKTYLAENTYGKNIKQSISEMDKATNSVISINGDFYGNSESGIVIRNGVEYRNNVNNADVCVLFKDGTMKTYSPSEYNAQEVISQGAWQAWSFGPSLLDGNGNILSSFNTNNFINSTNPRTALGYIAPGHYKFVVVDGRDKGYSKGVTISELAAIMAKEGCKSAYNMDGGNSSMMTFKGQLVNKPSGNGREISDIIYIA